MSFRLFNSLPFDRLQAPFESASDALARFDERLRSSPVAEAYVVRTHFHDACAALWREGEFVQVEDLVLHDANMDVRSPTHELVRAHAVLLARRRIAEKEPGWALTPTGLAALRGVRALADGSVQENNEIESIKLDDDEERELDPSEDAWAESSEFAEVDALLARTSKVVDPSETFSLTRDPSGLIYDEDWDEEARLSEWRKRLDETEPLAPLMSAGLALEAWETIEPPQHRAWLGPLLASALLRSRGKTRHHFAALHAGFRHAKYRRARRYDFATWLIAFAQAIEKMANFESKELDRLTLARELLLRKCAGKKGNSKLPRLVDLCLRSPIVAVPFAAKELKVSQQAASTMIGELSSYLRELTGRGRYRAWALM